MSAITATSFELLQIPNQIQKLIHFKVFALYIINKVLYQKKINIKIIDLLQEQEVKNYVTYEKILF